eukprot:scaffold625782_cov41-Prasinocladus_malaysianus.AAC.1
MAGLIEPFVDIVGRNQRMRLSRCTGEHVMLARVVAPLPGWIRLRLDYGSREKPLWKTAHKGSVM